ncbi:MarR family winged helix-turn-helix transcriptional regulator [Phytoactinopolyspora limicola]|uniref:MarR family winged helix-turn-helix transcriptional regulator n=1 Tax=Phytoactinopolyspora limicola TaxID=2715536 RepID=UPI0014087965|nr:MarR family transcriptional regulator [Phytoactinopolyspora limicola]
MGITDTERVLQIVGDLDRLLVGVRDPVLKQIGIGREHWQVLRLLADGEGHAMGEISDAMGLAGATATRVVDALAQKMQVYRRSDPLDRRRVLIFLAEPGRATLNQVDEVMLQRTDQLLVDFDPADRNELLRLLGQLVAVAATPASRPSPVAVKREAL